MTSARPLVRLIPAALLGAASTWAILLVGFHPAVILLLAGPPFVLLLQRDRRHASAFAVGAVATVVALGAVWTSGWGCASEVDGAIVEHDCGEPPNRR